jgi:acetoin utilization deacetylase AcuC-like enzyme
MNPTLDLYWHPDIAKHDHEAEHEAMAPNRLGFLAMALEQQPWIHKKDAIAPKDDAMYIAHDWDYLLELARSQHLLEGQHLVFNGETRANRNTWNTLRYSVGAAIQAVEQALSHQRSAFCMTYAGHHARYDQAHGFCFINNVATATVHAINQGADKVAVLDFDTHAGDGTLLLLKDNPRVFFGETYQPGFPGTFWNPQPEAATIVRHLIDDPYLFRDHWEHIFEQTQSFDPSLILVSAGFDAHYDDPLSLIGVSEETYAWLGTRLAQLQKPVVACMEGGYNMRSTRLSMNSFTEELAKANR